MGKKKRRDLTLERIMAQPIAKRLYVSLIPIDNLLSELKVDITMGEREKDDMYFLQIGKLRKGLVKILDKVLHDSNE